MRPDKKERLLNSGNIIFVKDGYLMYVHQYAFSFRASTNHDFLAKKISEELKYRLTLEEAVEDMKKFAKKYAVEVATL